MTSWCQVVILIAVASVASADYEEYYDDYEYESADRDSGYGGDDGGAINPLAAFLAPLAGLALLGAAAAVSINPVLVQLAVINGGKRKRRHARDLTTPVMERKMNEIELLEKFLSKETKFDQQAEHMTAQYLQCSGLATTNNQVSCTVGNVDNFWLIN